LIQVGPAYELLRKLQTSRPLVITSRAPVKTVLSGLLRTPDVGIGIYEREGWKSGDRGERTVTLTRESGPAAPMTFTLTWIGNDGTFESPASVALPLRSPVAVPIQITAKGEGAHTAILTLDHPDVPGHAYRMLHSIVVPYRLKPEEGYTVKADVTPPLPGDLPFFLDVPPGTAALSFTASSPAIYPTVIGPDKDSQYVCPFDAHFEKPPKCAVSRPQPGVWEINLSNSRVARNFDPEATFPLKATPVTVTATAVGLDVEFAGERTALEVGRAQSASISVKNRLGKVVAAASTVDLGSARRERTTIAAGQQQVHEIVVPKGASSLLARVGGPASARADLDVYLMDCTEPEKPAEKPVEKEKGNKSPMRPPAPCAVVAKAADVAPGGEVEAANPKAGRWVVVVDAFSTPDGPVEYEYTDFLSQPGLGAVAVADLPAERAPSAAWSAKAAAWAAGSPDPPRELAARVVATSPDVTKQLGPFGTGETARIPLGAAEVWFPRATAAGGGRR
jgi:hypothetical protein